MKENCSESTHSAPSLNAASTDEPIREYEVLQKAFDHFNRELFDRTLPAVQLTLLRRKRSRPSHFSANSFESRKVVNLRHEIALNPDHFRGRSDEEILSDLAHEMVHLWQWENGICGMGEYHNRQWAVRMNEIGLHPAFIGSNEDKQTGDARMRHRVVEGGRFQISARNFLKCNRLSWQDQSVRVIPRKVRFITPVPLDGRGFRCPECWQFATLPQKLNRRDNTMECGFCGKTMVFYMLPERLSVDLSLVRWAIALMKKEYDRDESGKAASAVYRDALRFCPKDSIDVFYLNAHVAAKIFSSGGPCHELRSKALRWIEDFVKRKKKKEDRDKCLAILAELGLDLESELHPGENDKGAGEGRVPEISDPLG